MYFRRGPIGLVIISILVLGFFMQIAQDSDMDAMVVILIAIFGCPLLSMIIYYGIESEKIKNNYKKLWNEDLRDFNYRGLGCSNEFNDDELEDDELEDDELEDDELEDEADYFDMNDPLYKYKKRNNTLNDNDNETSK